MKSVFTKEYTKFVEFLIEARKTAGLTQQELALKLKRPQSFVSKYERGERRLDVIEFLQVAKEMGLSATNIVSDLERDLAASAEGDAA